MLYDKNERKGEKLTQKNNFTNKTLMQILFIALYTLFLNGNDERAWFL